MSTQGLMALPTQWGFAEDAARKHGTTVSRSDWRVLLSWHIAETREQARREAGAGLMRWHNEYNVGTLQRPGLQPFTSPEDAVEKTAGGEAAASTIGTPDDLVNTIKSLMDVSGGVGTIVGFVHDWANPENTRRSWDMVARYVIPEINGHLTKLRESQKFVIENRAVFERAGQAVMAKIMENDKAAAALPLTGPGRVAIPTINAPDLQKEGGREAEGVRRLEARSRRDRLALMRRDPDGARSGDLFLQYPVPRQDNRKFCKLPFLRGDIDHSAVLLYDDVVAD
jgi:limonene 1,2-monooxygenase